MNGRATMLPWGPWASRAFVYAVLGLFVAPPTRAGTNVWTSTQPPFGIVASLALDLETPGTIYAGTDTGLFKSSDAGVSWTGIGGSDLSAGGINAVAFVATMPPTLYAGTGSGLFKSTDGGASWSGTGLGAAAVNFITIDPQTSGTVYVGVNGTHGLPPYLEANVFKSTDGGSSWRGILTGVNALVIDPATPTTLYAGASDGVFKSTTGGDRWDTASNGIDGANVAALAVDPATPRTLYAETSRGVFKTTDGAVSWNLADAGLENVYIAVLVVDTFAPDTIYAGAAPHAGTSLTGGVFKSTDGAATWHAVRTGLPSQFTDTPPPPVAVSVVALALDPVHRGALYAGTWLGVYKTTDAGASWRGGLPNPYVGSVAVDPDTSATVYAVAGGLLKSTDGGMTWSDTGLGEGGFRSVVLDPVAPSNIYVFSSQAPNFKSAVFKSTDGGDSWHDMGAGPDAYVRSLVVDPVTPTTLYAPTENGVFKTTDGARTWFPVNTGLTALNIVSLAIATTMPTTVYATGTGDGGGVFMTTDGGGHWQLTSSLDVLGFAPTLVIDPATPSTLYATGQLGPNSIFKSTDSGATWSATNTPGVYLIIDPTTPTTLYAYSPSNGSAAVFKSVDGGNTWTPFGTGLENLPVTSLAIAPSAPDTLYAGTASGGVFSIQQVPSCICTPTATPTPTRIPMMTPTPAIPLPSPTPRPTPPATSTVAPTATSSVTPTPSITLTPSTTPVPATPGPCVGDCDGSGAVTIDELVALVDMALGETQASACPHGLRSNTTANVATVIEAVHSALEGCLVCGNGVIDGDEECDDGNTVGGDGCAANCTRETRRPYRVSGVCRDVNSRPTNITAGPDGALWFTAATGIGRMTTAGIVTEFARTTVGGDITAGPDGALWFTAAGSIGRVTPAGAITEFNGSASGITAGPDGALWLAESSGIGRITTGGIRTEFPLPSGSEDIATGPDGALWFTTGNSVGRITTAGVFMEYLVPSAGQITAGPDGALWFTTGNSVGRITTAGVFTEYLVPSAVEITAGPDGALWFTEQAVDRIGRITTAGIVTEFLLPSAGAQPYGITAGPDGALWFTEPAVDRIGRITTAGAVTEFPLPTHTGMKCLANSDCGLDVCEANDARVEGQVISFPLSIVSRQALTAGRARASRGDGVMPVVIRADDVQVDPIPLPGLACLCLRAVAAPAFGPGNAGQGEIGCGPQGVRDVDIDSVVDHNITPTDPTCSTGFLEDGSLEHPHQGACNGPLRVTRSGGASPPGSAVLRLNMAVAVIPDGGSCATETNTLVCQGGSNPGESCYGPGSCDGGGLCVPAKGADGIPCTADDPLFGTATTFLATTGTARATVLNADDDSGMQIPSDSNCGGSSCAAAATGIPFDCAELQSDPPGGVTAGKLVSALPFLDLQSIGDVVDSGAPFPLRDFFNTCVGGCL